MRILFISSFCLSSVLFGGLPIAAVADPADPDQHGAECVNFVCQVESKRGGLESEVHSPRTTGGGKPGGGNSWDERAEEEARKAVQEYNQQFAAFERARSAYDNCIRRAATTCGTAPVPPVSSTLNVGGFPGQAAQPLPITGAQAAAIAVARLQLPTVAPGIGPSPDLNRWKMAAVGYPLWLWADGPTHVGPVSDSVAGLSVSLEARVTSLTFRMGDGNTVQCPGAGDKWTKAVEPGTKAPRCGYTYTEPSLPKGSYTVSALTDWAVTWTANGQSGVINVPAVQTTELPVGELQVLVR